MSENEMNTMVDCMKYRTNLSLQLELITNELNRLKGEIDKSSDKDAETLVKVQENADKIANQVIETINFWNESK